ncbi:MAG: hypothetical protein LQ342_002835 [Letrouitia transgressa]|nr:MAG: hypothetical protein LQ342_002835 [Letrouitia transgressa]
MDVDQDCCSVRINSWNPKLENLIDVDCSFTSVSSLGPILLHYVPPTEEEVFARYSPELKKRSLENRDRLREEWTDYITKLNELSKSDLNIWEAWKEEERNRVKAEAEALEKKTEQLRLRMKEEEEPSASTK